MLKKALISLFAISSSFSAAHADNHCCCPEIYCGGWNIGATVSNASGDVEHFITIGYFNNYFLADFGVNFERLEGSSLGDVNLFAFSGHLGLRHRISNNLFFTYGAMGVAENKAIPQVQYTVGAFIGLDLQIFRHFLLSGKINPFAYEQLSREGRNTYQVFESGSLNWAYVF